MLNDVPHQSIPDATRQRVLAAAEELDYTPHAAARTLRAGESRLVLFINAGIPYGANLSAIIDTLSAEVAASGRSLVVWQQHDPGDLAATLAHLQPAMAITLGRLNEDQRELLARARIPSVETDTGQAPDAADTGAALQVRYLASRGHRRLGYLTTADLKLGMFASPRLAGVRSACAELGLDPPAVAELAALPDVPVDELSAALQLWASRPASGDGGGLLQRHVRRSLHRSCQPGGTERSGRGRDYRHGRRGRERLHPASPDHDPASRDGLRPPSVDPGQRGAGRQPRARAGLIDALQPGSAPERLTTPRLPGASFSG